MREHSTRPDLRGTLCVRTFRDAPIATDRTTPPQPRAGEPACPDDSPGVPPDGATLWLRFPHGTCPDAASLADVVGAATGLALHRDVVADGGSLAADVMFDTAIFRISGLDSNARIAIRHTPDIDTRTLPMAAQWMGCAAALVAGWPDCIAALWSPSGQLCDRTPFLTAIAQWQSRGVLPLRFLVALTPTDDGRIRTTGLRYFTGQELVLNPVGEDRDAGCRLAETVTRHLIQRSTIAYSEDMMAPDGTTLRLTPSDDGKTVQAQRA